MSKKTDLFYIFKFNSKFLIERAIGKDMKYTVDEARKDLNLVSLADNQVFHFLRKIKGTPFDREKLDKLYKLRNDEKSLPKVKRNLVKIEKYQKQIDDILFIPDIITVKMSSKKDYLDLTKNGFSINGIKFVRLVCTAAYLRRNIVGFINEKYFKELNEILMCGLDGKLKETNLGKFSAYYGLFMSAVNKVDTPRVCVIPDYETDLRNQMVDFIVTDPDGKRHIEEREKDMPMNWFDGMGLISPEMAKKWQTNLGLDYLPSGFVIRSAYIKGLVVPFDFHDFAKNVAFKETITDAWGKEYNIEDIDVILTISQFKMWKAYENWQEYLYYSSKYGHIWGVSRVNKKNDDEYVLTNYQYLQTLNLNKEDIHKLAQPTVDWINNIGSGKLEYVLLYLLGCQNGDVDDFEAEDILSDVEMNFVKGIMLDSDLLKDDYVRAQIYKTLKRKIKDAKIGRLWVRGNYVFQISDPYALCEWAFGMEVNGLVGAYKMYCNFWNTRTDSKEILCCRSPLVHGSEHLLRELECTDKMKYWYKYLESGIINSVKDMAVVHMSDSDYDGDIIFSTDNKIMINALPEKRYPITYDKRKAPNQKLTQKNLIKNDLNGFGSRIGQITNTASTMIAKQASFEKGSPEWEELELRIKLLRMYQGEEIDKAKGLTAQPIPKYWTKKEKIDYENDTEEEISRKQFNNRIVADKKPYFMGYIYPKMLEDHKKYQKKNNIKALRKFGKNINDLLATENKTEQESHMVMMYNRYQPTLKNKCAMNELCSYVERMDFDLKYFKKKKENEFDYKKMLSEDYLVRPRSMLYQRVDGLIKKYKGKLQDMSFSTNLLISSDMSKKDVEEFIKELSYVNHLYFLEKDIERIGINTSEVYNYFVEIIYSKYKQGYNILWDIFSNDILQQLNNGKMVVPIEDKNGDTEYFGKRYSLMEVNLNDNI